MISIAGIVNGALTCQNDRYRSEASQFEKANEFLGQGSKNPGDEEYKVAGDFFPSLGLETSITSFYGNPQTVLHPSNTCSDRSPSNHPTCLFFCIIL